VCGLGTVSKFESTAHKAQLGSDVAIPLPKLGGILRRENAWRYRSHRRRRMTKKSSDALKGRVSPVKIA
jgi:hypothetical protein